MTVKLQDRAVIPPSPAIDLALRDLLDRLNTVEQVITCAVTKTDHPPHAQVKLIVPTLFSSDAGAVAALIGDIYTSHPDASLDIYMSGLDVMDADTIQSTDT